MINKDNIEILYPGIMVFRGGIKDPYALIEKIEEYGQWEPWYDVGKQILFNIGSFHMFRNGFPTDSEWNESKLKHEASINPIELKEVIDILENAFYESTKYYFEQYEGKLDNWMHSGSNILKYEGRAAKAEELSNESKVTAAKHDTTTGAAGGTKELTLPFHTDFYQADEFVEGPKAEYTVTIYLNDDYEGGEIDYRIFNGKETEVRLVDGDLVAIDPSYGDIPKIAYRPQAGDIIIFPSRPPFYHGVRRVQTGTKRFVRMFWMSQLEVK